MDQRVQIAIRLMKDEFHQGIALDELASSVNLSLSRFHHLFKAETGTTPARYLRELRMEKAKKLLETSFANIKQIMVQIGIQDRSHFEREFKRTYGLTPAQYRTTSGLVLSATKPDKTTRNTNRH